VEELEKKIELLRKKMVKLGNQKGLAHKEVLQCSKELDELLNKRRRDR
jgi:hypothetical protein